MSTHSDTDGGAPFESHGVSLREVTKGGHITLTTAAEPYSLPAAQTPEGERRVALLFCRGSESVVRFLATHEVVLVGRSEPADVVLADPSVSRQHVRFGRDGDLVWAEDLGSHNGTMIRGRRIAKEPLAAGDEVLIGQTRVLVAATTSNAAAHANGVKDASGPVLGSPAMVALYEQAARAASSALSVLVLGETGSGKEHVALTIHERSDRRHKPFVVVNCAAIAPTLLESTLFGHEKGAFTGAHSRNIGVFERADGGTLFLDEVGELTPSAQAALLRAVETRRVSRIGGSAEIPVDVRFVAATHCDLESMIEEKTFRSDLYYRLAGVELRVPPLRKRTQDVEPLVRRFLKSASEEWSVGVRDVTPEALDALRQYSWPGNVRQLKQAVERAVLLGTGSAVTLADLPSYLTGSSAEVPLALPSLDVSASLRDQVRAYESALILRALERAGGNRQVAAKLLRVPLRTLFRKMRGGTRGGDAGGSSPESSPADDR